MPRPLLLVLALLSFGELWAAQKTTTTMTGVVKAAEMLGVSRPTLYDLMRKLAIK